MLIMKEGRFVPAARLVDVAQGRVTKPQPPAPFRDAPVAPAAAAGRLSRNPAQPPGFVTCQDPEVLAEACVTKGHELMTATTETRCTWRSCGQPVKRAGTGRPPRYCSATCRQAAHRERVRQAEAAAARAARLASARAAAARALPLARKATGQLAEQARVVFLAAADDQAGRAGLSAALRGLDRRAARLRQCGEEYRNAADEVAALVRTTGRSR
jgi:hypothetical protein